jgi:hypothetical protein
VAATAIALALAVLLGYEKTRSQTLHFLSAHWGDIASVLGLGVSIGALWFAKGAREAAQEAASEVEEAASEARAAARVRAALEELQDAAQKCTQLRTDIGAKKWDLVQVRAEEVMQSCRTTVARWGTDEALKDSRTRLLQVATAMRGIIEETSKEEIDIAAVREAQLDAHEKLSATVGKIQGHSDQRSD